MQDRFTKKELEKALETSAIFYGDREHVYKSLYENFSIDGSDIYNINEFEVKVEEVDRLVSWIYKTSEMPKVAIVSSFYWNTHVQNSLLKVLEESPQGVRIFIVVASSAILLPTVVSRLPVYAGETMFGIDEKSRFAKLDSIAVDTLTLQPYLRLESSKVKKIMSAKTGDSEDDEGEDLPDGKSRKDRELHIMFFESLIRTMLASRATGKVELSKEYLGRLGEASTAVWNYGTSPHLYIEWLLLSAPVI